MSPAPPLAPLARVAPRALRPRRLPGTRSARFRTPVARAVAHGCSPAPSVALFAVARPSGWQSGAPARPTPVRAASLAAVPPVLALPAPRAAAGPALALLAVARPSGWRSGAPTRPTLARAALAPLAPLAAAHPALALPAPRAAARSARCGAPVGVAEEARAAATCCRTWERNRGAGGGGSSSASSLEMAGSVGRREGEHAGRLPW
ncbi:hypothetical protein BRADI_2g10915v3 [Brachypodium distachyon]|uniref:Uncharacterized protein n=1 Tax=Brachypodium distachyon TaxID=15368 RepID=A0A2K2D7U8_BRADI|nr:hypothetical protein BRADI_2g10915v3 [Brachypodium distachyon]